MRSDSKNQTADSNHTDPSASSLSQTFKEKQWALNLERNVTLKCHSRTFEEIKRNKNNFNWHPYLINYQMYIKKDEWKNTRLKTSFVSELINFPFQQQQQVTNKWMKMKPPNVQLFIWWRSYYRNCSNTFRINF